MKWLDLKLKGDLIEEENVQWTFGSISGLQVVSL